MSFVRRSALMTLILAVGAFAQTKKGVFGKITDKIDKINQKIDSNTPKTTPSNTSTSPAPASGINQQAAATRATVQLNRREAKGTCNAWGWDPSIKDPEISFGPEYVATEESRFEPEPLQPEASISLNDIAHTQTFRLQFPPRPTKTSYQVRNAQTGAIEHRMITVSGRPFEYEFELHDGLLYYAQCHDLKYEAWTPAVVAKGGHIPGFLFDGLNTQPVEDFRCPDCYFLNQQFIDFQTGAHYVILVSPTKAAGFRYALIRGLPKDAALSVRVFEDDICKHSKREEGVDCRAAEFSALQRHADGQHKFFPGVKFNYWTLECTCTVRGCRSRVLEQLGPFQSSTNGQR